MGIVYYAIPQNGYNNIMQCPYSPSCRHHKPADKPLPRIQAGSGSLPARQDCGLSCSYATVILISSLPPPLFLEAWDTDKHDCHGRLRPCRVKCRKFCDS